MHAYVSAVKQSNSTAMKTTAINQLMCVVNCMMKISLDNLLKQMLDKE